MLSLTATGPSVQGGDLDGAASITHGQLDGDTSYIVRAATDDGDQTYGEGDECTGSIEWTKNDIKIAMTGSAGDGCSEAISGSFRRPEK